MKQIAEMVDVSKQAVYSVLSNKPRCLVSAEKKEKILFLARAYHYKQNIAAVSLNGKSTLQIGAVIDNFTNTEGRILTHLSRKLAIENFSLQASAMTSVLQGMEMVQRYISSGADAVVFSGRRLKNLHYAEYGKPLLAIDEEFGTDYSAGCRQVTEHLIHCHGHRKILHVASEKGAFPKYLGYREAMKKAGLTPLPVLHTILNSEFSNELKRYLDKGVTAFVVSGDDKASRLIYLLRSIGVRVPEDAAVVGFDGFGDYPEIASVVDPVEQVAALGCQMLLEKIRGNVLQALKPRMVEPSFQPSASCGCPPIRFDNIGEYYSDNGLILK
ncbi:MAG: LacI family DNA-binding transcriptional regulator [Victivallales bacterium]|nr:LacI family DNA-binding transcriptional regulator [Victivallales bacterium]